MKYTVTNKAKDFRKFRDSFLGRDVILGPGESTFTNKPPKESEIWRVEEAHYSEKSKINHTEKLEKKPTAEKEVKK